MAFVKCPYRMRCTGQLVHQGNWCWLAVVSECIQKSKIHHFSWPISLKPQSWGPLLRNRRGCCCSIEASAQSTPFLIRNTYSHSTEIQVFLSKEAVNAVQIAWRIKFFTEICTSLHQHETFQATT